MNETFLNIYYYREELETIKFNICRRSLGNYLSIYDIEFLIVYVAHT